MFFGHAHEFENIYRFVEMFRHDDCDFAWFIAMLSIKKAAGRHPDIKEIIFNQEFHRRKALRVIPRGKQRLTVYRAHQVSGGRSEK